MKRYIGLILLGCLFTFVNVWESARAAQRWFFITGATTDEEDTDIKFMVREKGDIITELILIAGGQNEENALIVIKGEIDLASIGAIGRSMDIEGLEQLEKLKGHK